MTDSLPHVGSVQMQIEIKASAATVWQALVDNIGEWWPAEFYTGGDSARRTFRIEPKPGGRMYEDWGDDCGTLWGTVVAVDPGRKLQIHGMVFPDYGGPNHNFGTWLLEEANGTTTMTYSEASIGRVSDAGVEEKDKGWKFLWATMKAHIEGQPLPVWAD